LNFTVKIIKKNSTFVIIKIKYFYIMKRVIIFTFVFIAAILTGCRHRVQLHNGLWHAELAVAENKQAPFLFEVHNAATDSATVTLLNGDERVVLTGVSYIADTVVIPIDIYDAALIARLTGNALEGRFVRNYIQGDTGTVFTARLGGTRFALNADDEFAAASHPAIDGKWDVFFIGATGDTVYNVGIFKSDNGIVTGSVLTNSGDMRFLEGTSTGAGIQLSAFSGQSPYLFEITFTGVDTFEGTRYTVRSATRFTGRRNPNAALANAYTLTGLKNGSDRLHFRLPSLTDSLPVALTDDRYKNKVVVVSILGSWCPNCLDEAGFLSPWYRDNRARGVEIVGLAFERNDSFAYAKAAIARLRLRYAIDYEILFAGQASGKNITAVLPEIENFAGYPTTIFIDRQGKVAKIHAGFSGPATGEYYEEFQREFNAIVDSLGI
jgi:thiol-disulfide isomerase/thioredoxin